MTAPQKQLPEQSAPRDTEKYGHHTETQKSSGALQFLQQLYRR